MAEPVRYRYFYVVALPLPRGRKTHVYEIRNAGSDNVLGTIEWYGPWRQFCFVPKGATVWSAGCLQDVRDFIAKHAGKEAGGA